MRSYPVRNGRGDIVGYRCKICGEVYESMWGDVCNKCRREERWHKELLEEIRKLKEAE